jgi:antitoxin HigA-1
MTNGESSSDGGMHSNGMYPLSTIIRIMTAINRLECVTPGEILSEEFIKPMDLTQTQVSRDARIPASRLTEIIKGRRSITAETALRLSAYFGTTPGFWLGLQTAHDLEVAQRAYGQKIKSEVNRLAVAED